MDIFNPNHYLPRTYLDEKPNAPLIIDENQLVSVRKNIFNNIHIDLINGKSDDLHYIHDKKMSIVTSKTHHINHFMSNSTLIIENISLNKSKTLQHIYVAGDCELYILTNNMSEQLSYTSMNISLEENAKLKVFMLNTNNNQKVKYDFTYYLNSQSQLDIKTLSLIATNQYQDDSIIAIHSNNSTSNIEYRSLTEGVTVSQVNSIIPVNAPKSSTAQHLKHTMLHERAKVFSKPNLEISNADVSASHGNSIGSFDDEHIFYLEQRGINKDKAISLLLQSEIDNFLSQTSLSEELSKYIKTMEKNYENL